jgi:hypothetical protein
MADDSGQFDPLRRRGSIRRELMLVELEAPGPAVTPTFDEWCAKVGFDAVTREYIK